MTTFDHRGRPVGGNHRPTPRLAQALARKYERSMTEGVYQMMGFYPKVFLPGDVKVGTDSTQQVINDYRQDRDAKAKLQASVGRVVESDSVTSLGNAISDSFKERNIDNSSHESRLQETIARDTGDRPYKMNYGN